MVIKWSAQFANNTRDSDNNSFKDRVDKELFVDQWPNKETSNRKRILGLKYSLASRERKGPVRIISNS